MIKRHKSFDISISSRILKALPPNRRLLWGRFFEFTHKFILFSCFLRLHYFLIFLSFSFSCLIFKLIECKKNLVPYCTFSLTFSLIFKNWNSLSFGFMAKVKKRKEISLQDRETFISFASFLKVSQNSLRWFV